MSRRKRGRKSVGSAGAAASGPADGGREPGRFSARRKTETILRLLRGESLDSLARELGVTAATLAQWREAHNVPFSGVAPSVSEDHVRLQRRVGRRSPPSRLCLPRLWLEETETVHIHG